MFQTAFATGFIPEAQPAEVVNQYLVTNHLKYVELLALM